MNVLQYNLTCFEPFSALGISRVLFYYFFPYDMGTTVHPFPDEGTKVECLAWSHPGRK